MSEIAGPAAAALSSLSPDDVIFLQSLPKAELHAHLNGSIPIKTILELAQQYSPSSAQTTAVADTIEKLKSGVILNEIFDFFSLMPAIYALTSTLESVVIVTRAVLQSFLNTTGDDTETPQCAYLELRTTPRTTPHMTRERYLTVVLDEIEMYPATQAALIVSVDRRMSDLDVEECISLAIEMKNRGRRVVGIDVCGDPRSGDMQSFTRHLSRAKGAGLGLTVHIAEVCNVHLCMQLNNDRICSPQTIQLRILWHCLVVVRIDSDTRRSFQMNSRLCSLRISRSLGRNAAHYLNVRQAQQILIRQLDLEILLTLSTPDFKILKRVIFCALFQIALSPRRRKRRCLSKPMRRNFPSELRSRILKR